MSLKAEKRHGLQSGIDLKQLKLEISPRALDQLDDIQIELEEARLGRSVKFIEKLRKCGELLLLFPEMGVPKDGLRAGVRSIFVWEYVLLYEITEDLIWVLAVLHGARDIESLFTEL